MSHLLCLTLAAAMSATLTSLDQSHTTAWGRPGGLLIAAPPDRFDLHTDEMARTAALYLNGSYLVAIDERPGEHPWNVDRRDGGRIQAHRTPRAAAFRTAWAEQVSAFHPLLYAELRGESRRPGARSIDVTIEGLSRGDTAFLQQDFARRVTAMPADLPCYWLRIAGLDPLPCRRTPAVSAGLRHAVQFELPFALRADARIRERYAQALAESLAALEARLEAANRPARS